MEPTAPVPVAPPAEPPTPAPAATPIAPVPAQAGGQQIVDVVAPPVQTAEEVADAKSATEAAPVAPQPVTAPKQKREFSADVKLAIIATVVIVVVLGILATVAFLKQK